MGNITRRQFMYSVPASLGAGALLSACGADSDDYSAAANSVRRPISNTEGMALRRELVRYATLAPSSHNTQCWKFAIEDQAIIIQPDLLRRCPAVDPDDHHLFVSLGCATENLVQAALAHGLMAEPRFDLVNGNIRVALAPTRPQLSALFNAIPTRQCTRADYDARPIASEEIGLLERAGTANNVRMQIFTEHRDMERVLEYVVQANTAQMADAAFIKELKSWIRFNGRDALRSSDGLYSATTGNPNVPTWLGELGFGLLFRSKSENDKYVHQIRSSAGIAIFTGLSAERANWIDVGRCYERFALQATALGIRNAMINQPVEVISVRPQFAAAFGMGQQRPDLVVRFGRGPTMPASMRRTLEAVLV